VYNRPSSHIRVALVADNPLLASGLQRTAHLLGFEEVTEAKSADLALRIAGIGSCHPTLDIECAEEHVVLTVTEQPSPALWSAVRDLLEHLLPAHSVNASSEADDHQIA
jgi:hypothetical protein